ncbi:MAG: DUF3277 family protein [Cytophagaceae bacterium]|nr:MAG: DUF3277 family protein [Cytophagaceae bacterium]
MPVRTYDPALVTWIWGGEIATGFAEDTAISVEMMSDAWADQAGVDGSVSRSRSNDYRGTVTVNLSQSSPTNDKYQALHNADLLTGLGASPGLLRDASGRTIITGDSGWIVKAPPAEFGRSLSNRQWVIRFAHLVMAIGGNS